MTNSELLEYVHRINNALALGQLEAVAGDITRAGITARMHEGLPPDAFTEKMRNEWLLGRFLSIMDDSAYKLITPWLDETLAIFRKRWADGASELAMVETSSTES